MLEDTKPDGCGREDCPACNPELRERLESNLLAIGFDQSAYAGASLLAAFIATARAEASASPNPEDSWNARRADLVRAFAAITKTGGAGISRSVAIAALEGIAFAVAQIAITEDPFSADFDPEAFPSPGQLAEKLAAEMASDFQDGGAWTEAMQAIRDNAQAATLEATFSLPSAPEPGDND